MALDGSSVYTAADLPAVGGWLAADICPTVIQHHLQRSFMDNLRCTEYLSDSPSTSNTLNVNTAVTISQSRRRSVKITNEERFHHEQGRLVLGQVCCYNSLA
uniref:Uncharacterized protein n=1 Tax=Ascaris lumbricoides TaxID=6252 RepID=A0A0M3I833_ASCLU